MNQKKFFLLIMLSVTAVIISGCRPGSANANQAWPVYENSDYGYGFNYPSNCTYGPLPEDCKSASLEDQRAACLCFLDAENPDNVLMQFYQRDDEGQFVLAEFKIMNLTKTVNSLPDNPASIKGWLADTFPEKYGSAGIADITIGGEPAVSHSTLGSEMAPAVEEIYFLDKGQLFQVRMLNPDEIINHQLYESILTSFRFDG